MHENDPEKGAYLYYLGDYFVRKAGDLNIGISYLEKALTLFMATPEVEPEEAEIYDFFKEVGESNLFTEVGTLLVERVQTETDNHILRLFFGELVFWSATI